MFNLGTSWYSALALFWLLTFAYFATIGPSAFTLPVEAMLAAAMVCVIFGVLGFGGLRTSKFVRYSVRFIALITALAAIPVLYMVIGQFTF